jgi:hypothetical protein
MSLGRLVAVSLLFTAAALAQPQLTTIQDTLYSANGTLMNATAVITWYSFEASDTSSVGQQSLSVQITNGILFVQLVPNTTATPIEPYTVNYQSDGLMQYQEVWMVPPSTTPLRVSDVRISSNSVPGNTGAGGGVIGSPITETSTNIPESQVTGLVSDLAARPLKGASYGTSRVAIVDNTGAIDTVVGNTTDCVYVDGTSGPCFDATQLPGYSDGEIPAGVVDGSNYTFGLIAQPGPALSLQLFRNGIMQQQGFDYTLTGSVITFASGATPQPGDTVIAWYRTLPLQGGNLTGGGGVIPVIGGAVIIPTLNAQVICSATGTQTNATTLTTLGTCTIPGDFLLSGDRLDIRFLFSHTGTAGGFTYGVNWGATNIVQRNGGTADALATGRADASITGAATPVAEESYGTILPDLALLTMAPDSIASPITIAFQASIGNASADTVNLVNYSVVRFPAISHP